MKFLKNSLVALSLVCISACNNNISVVNTDLSLNNVEASNAVTASQSKYLCVSLPTGGASEIIKVQNLKTKELTSLFVPGSVEGMSEDLENNIIYVSSKTEAERGFYSLFKLDLKTRQISRILSFSQLGMRPTDFLVDKTKVYVSGKKGGIGAFYGNDLLKNEWFAVANNISEGKIEYGFNQDTFHVVSYDDNAVTRTIVNVKNKQIVERKTIKHDIPFGNNVFIPSQHGAYVYILHQLKDSFIPYAFNVKRGTFTKFPEVQTNGGLLYSAIVSNDGKHLLTNVNREIYHYKLEADKLIALPKINLDIPESRNMDMAGDNRTLYVTHETGDKMSVVKFSPDLTTYTTTQMLIGGSTNKVFLF